MDTKHSDEVKIFVDFEINNVTKHKHNYGQFMTVQTRVNGSPPPRAKRLTTMQKYLST